MSDDLCDRCDRPATYWQASLSIPPMTRCPQHTPPEDCPQHDDDHDPLTVVRIVAEHWRDAAQKWPDTAWAGDLLTNVLAAADGQTDPTRLGIPADHPAAERIRQAVDRD